MKELLPWQRVTSNSEKSDKTRTQNTTSQLAAAEQLRFSAVGRIARMLCRGIKRFRMLGGVSGGSIISSLAASGLDSKQLLHSG